MSMFGRIKTTSLLILVLLTAARLSPPLPALAQSETPYDLINAVNDLRALHGLQPYNIDSGLMTYAQEHTDYQAAMKTSTHVHRDGTLPWSIGLQENVASGVAGFVTVAVVVYDIWVDWGHRHILIGYATGDIGAGIAFSNDGSAYYTVDIRPGEELAATEAPFAPLQTSMPGPDGSVIHIVEYGQTLWSIALSYGVTVDDIRRLNKMPADSTVIRVGQRLLIRPAGSRTGAPSKGTPSSPTQSSSPTVKPIAATTLSAESVMPTPSFTVVPTRASAPASAQQTNIGWIVTLAVAILGLSIAAAIGFWQAHKDKAADSRK